MFDLNIRLQIAAIVIFIIMVIDFIRSKKLNIYSTKAFAWLLGFSGINLVFDVITVYTISHLDDVPGWINRFCHQVFIGSLDVLILSLYFYVHALCKKQERIKKNWIGGLILLPFFFSMIMVVFGPLKYHISEEAVYSYGLMADTVSISVAFYMGLSIAELIRYRKTFSLSNFVSITLGISLWIAATIVHMIVPRILLSGIALVGMLVILYFSYENPKEHQDEETKSFNKRAFLTYLSEVVNGKKDYSIVNVVVEDLTSINRIYGYEKGNSVLTSICSLLYEDCCSVFHIRGNVISILVLDKEKLEFILAKVSSFLNKSIPVYVDKLEVAYKTLKNGKIISVLQNKRYVSDEIPITAHIDVIDRDAISSDNINRIMSIIDFMADKSYGNRSASRISRFDTILMKEEERKNALLEIVSKAINKDGFEMVFQPIFNVTTNSFSSAEALVRLKDNKTIGFVSPEEFIPIAEKYGLINELSNIIFDKVCSFISNSKLMDLGLKYVEVNLSAIQCVDLSLPSLIEELLKKYQINPEQINLEITETALVESDEKMLINMESLKKLGCTFAMDDFGTGYSNLSKIAEVTYDLIKLDKSLIWPCFGEKKSDKAIAILSNVMNMLYELNVEIVAEGVETKEQLDYLIEHNVTHIQGYYFSKPLYQKDFLDFIKKNNNID